MADNICSANTPARHSLRAAGPCRVLTTDEVLALVVGASSTHDTIQAGLGALVVNYSGCIGVAQDKPVRFRSADRVGMVDLVAAQVAHRPDDIGIVASRRG